MTHYDIINYKGVSESREVARGPNSKGNSHSWDILPETWDMTPCFRVTIPGSWVYILVKKCRSQVRLFGKNQVYLVEVITKRNFFNTISLRLISNKKLI